MMNKLDFLCRELQVNKQALLSTKDKRYRKTKTEVNKRWIVFLFYRKFNISISQIARFLKFDRFSIYNCIQKANEEQIMAADMLFEMYNSPDYGTHTIPIYQTRLVPDYLHSRCEYRPVRIN